MKWTKANRKKLHGFILDHKSNPPPFPDEPWERCCELVEGLTVRGEDPPLAAATEVLAEMDGDPPGKLDAKREVYRCGLVMPFADKEPTKWEDWERARALVAFWGRNAGADFALKVLLQKRFVAIGGSSESSAVFMKAGETDWWVGPFGLANRANAFWWAMRLLVDEIDEAAFAKVRELAVARLNEKLGDGNDWRERSVLLFALRRDEELVEKELTRMVDAYGRGWWEGRAFATVAARSARLAEKIVACGPGRFGPLAWDVVEAFPDESETLLEAILAANTHSNKRLLKAEHAALKFVTR